MSDLPPVIDGTLRPSFCFSTITDRWPKIVTKIIDQLHQYYKEAVKKFGEDGGKDTNKIISQLSELRYLITTGKPLKNIADAPDASVWNEELERYRKNLGETNANWFKVPWLFVECYLYRKIMEFFSTSVYLRNYDPFANEKKKSYFDSKTHMISLGTELIHITDNCNTNAKDLRDKLLGYLQIALWGNKCDLSLSGGDPHYMSDTIFQELVEMRDKILVDHLDEFVDKHILNKSLKRIDIVLDNAGLELFTDLCLADFLVSKSLVDKVVLHGKTIPWFVSDVTQADFDWMINELLNSDDSFISQLGSRWSKRIVEKTFVFEAHPFWTHGFAYCEMKERSPDLYEELSNSDLVIFKGDLNYRKLVGDRQWPYSTEFKNALQGFEPTTIFSLRTLKAETVAGLSESTVKTIEEKFGKDNLEWMVTGNYAVAQLYCPN